MIFLICMLCFLLHNELMAQSASANVPEICGTDDRFCFYKAEINEQMRIFRESLQQLQDKNKELRARVDLLEGNSTNVAFFALRTAGGLSGTTQVRRVTFQTVPLNIGDGFNTHSSHFQATIAGVYQFYFGTISARDKQVSLQLVKNGEAIVMAHSGYVSGSNGYRNSNNMGIVQLAQGDEVWVELRQYAVFVIDGHGLSTTFSGYLIFKT